jgi:hypothetical protein
MQGTGSKDPRLQKFLSNMSILLLDKFLRKQRVDWPTNILTTQKKKTFRHTCNTQIDVRFLHHRHLYLGSMSFFKFSNLWPFLTFSNDVYGVCPNPNQKSTIDLRIWKGCRFEEWTSNWVWTLIWVYHTNT